MNAILLAAGFGTRLRPITNNMPKCLVQIRGQVLLDIWLQNLMKAGVESFLINTHYLPVQVETYINQSVYKDKVMLIHEQQLLGTAGTLIANLDFFKGQDGLLIHADNYCLADFKVFFETHLKRPPQCVMTMMTFRADDPSACGIVELNDKGVVVAFHEKVTLPPGNIANGAVYLLSAEFLEQMARELMCVNDFSTEVLPRFIGRIYTYETKEIFMDIGTPQAYELANK